MTLVVPEVDENNSPVSGNEGDRTGRSDHFLVTASIAPYPFELQAIEHSGPAYPGTRIYSLDCYRDRIKYKLGALFGIKYVRGEIKSNEISDWVIKYASGQRLFDLNE